MAFWNRIPRIEVQFAAPAGGFFGRGGWRGEPSDEVVEEEEEEEEEEYGYDEYHEDELHEYDERPPSPGASGGRGGVQSWVGGPPTLGRGRGSHPTSMSVPHEEPMTRPPPPPPHGFFVGSIARPGGHGHPDVDDDTEVRSPPKQVALLRESLSDRLASCGESCGRACASLPEIELYVPDAPPRVIATARACAAGVRRGAIVVTAAAMRAAETTGAAAAALERGARTAAARDFKAARPRELASRAAAATTNAARAATSAAMTAGKSVTGAGRRLTARCYYHRHHASSSAAPPSYDDDEEENDDDDDDGDGGGGGGATRREGGGVRTSSIRSGAHRGRPQVVFGGLRVSRMEVYLLLVVMLSAFSLTVSSRRWRGGGGGGGDAGELRDDEWGSELEELARARRVNRRHSTGGRFRFGWGGGDGGGGGGRGALIGHRLGGGGGGGGGEGRGEGSYDDGGNYDGPESTGSFSGGWRGGWGGKESRWGVGGGGGGGGRINMLRGGPLVDPSSLEELLQKHSRTTPLDGNVGLDGNVFYRQAAETFRSNVEREFQTPAQRLSKRQFDEETKRMMSQLTNRIAGTISTQSKAGLASAAEHLAAAGKAGSGGGGARATVDEAEEVLEKQLVMGQTAQAALVVFLLEHPGCRFDKPLGKTSKETLKDLCVRFFAKRRREREAREKKPTPLSVAQATRG